MKYNIYDTEEYDISDDLYFLRFFSEYNNWKTDKCNILYENKNTVGLNSIRSFFKLDPLIIKNNQLKTILNIKKYASDILHFAGEKIFDRKYDNLNCFDLLNLAKKEGKSLNCRYITSVFTQMLLSIGYKARWVSCHSMDIRDKECHCVCEVYIDSLKKWIVCDPSFNCLYFNKKGNILNLYEMRKLIIKGERLIIAG